MAGFNNNSSSPQRTQMKSKKFAFIHVHLRTNAFASATVGWADAGFIGGSPTFPAHRWASQKAAQPNLRAALMANTNNNSSRPQRTQSTRKGIKEFSLRSLRFSRTHAFVWNRSKSNGNPQRTQNTRKEIKGFSLRSLRFSRTNAFALALPRNTHV